MFNTLNLVFKSWVIEQFKVQKLAYERERNTPASHTGNLILGLWFTFAFVCLKPQIAGVPAWRLPLIYYPHINFASPSLLDPVRFALQSLWLLCVRPQSPGHLKAQLQAGTKQLIRRVKGIFYLPLGAHCQPY